MQTRFDFTDRIALITGAAGGIGGALARLLASSGATVVLADLDVKAVNRLASEIVADGGRTLSVALDAGDADSVDALVDAVRDAYGRIDFLVPSAGVYPTADVTEISDDDWRLTQRINLEAVFLLTKRALQLMPDGAAIVNVASIAGHRGSPGHAHYAASKGGLIAFTRSLAAELGPRGIRVNVVSPGIIETDLTVDVRAMKGAEWVAATPLGSNGQPEEVAAVIAFLLSDAAAFVHGEAVHVNGGLFMAG